MVDPITSVNTLPWPLSLLLRFLLLILLEHWSSWSMSCCTSQLTRSLANPYFLWLLNYRRLLQLAFKQNFLECSERKPFVLFYISFSGVLMLISKFFGQANASQFVLNKFSNTNFVYCFWNNGSRNHNSDSTLKCPNRDWRYSFSSAWISATLGKGVFKFLAKPHRLLKFS